MSYQLYGYKLNDEIDEVELDPRSLPTTATPSHNPQHAIETTPLVLTKTLPVNKHLSTRSPESLPPVNNLSSSSRGSRGLCSVSDCPTFVVVAFVVDDEDEDGSSDKSREV